MKFPSFLLMALTLTLCLSTPHLAFSKEECEVSLFDGESLNGWTAENEAVAEVQNGELLLKAGDGWLRSDHTYGDFKLHVEWKALKADGYDAGIYLRASREGKPFPKRGYQINLKQGQEGTLIRVNGGKVSGLIKPGEWNTFDITASGKQATLNINGKQAYQVEGLEIPRGFVGIQVEVPLGGQFLFRNIRITELNHISLLDQNTLTHWEGAGQPAEACWELKNGVLTGLKKKGPWLRSAEEYGDFNLRLEYKVDEGANSGIYVRVPENGNHHRDNEKQPPAGFEVQILDDAAKKYAKLKPYQYCGSVYDIEGANPKVCKPAGHWNTLEINCDGQNITTTHNGMTIVRVTPEKNPLIKLRKTEGFLGLQNHGGGVTFRNLRIGPAIKGPLP
ncbi:MAG: DUF1080 domain-containing protein [Planctomycetaceae bacterium]|nr:DUF1080 domain-containing protein [Planctomycetaceae bacterium]